MAVDVSPLFGAPGSNAWHRSLGAHLIAHETVQFRVWAPNATSVAIKIVNRERLTQMRRDDNGYHTALVEGLGSQARYYYVLDGVMERPDPASQAQPEGVHGPSMVIDPNVFSWTDGAWHGRGVQDFIIYELHVGTFTKEGTFDAVIPYLRYLKEQVGITAIEIMPIAEFPGRRNWGYDGTYLFAPHSSYGGAEGCKRLVNACHEMDLAVVLDVVYNHLGPEGNYLADFGPYFTDRYKTPWGAAVNYDGPDSNAVRDYVVANALYWVTEYHIDGLRLDAIHGIYDFSADHIVHELTRAVHRQGEHLGRQTVIIAESDLNDVRVIAPSANGGYDVDAQWNDDFHHALRVALTGESKGYYRDFNGLLDLGKALQSGFVYTGQHSAFRRRRHGNACEHRPSSQFVVFAQNHDQIGNRAIGDRLSVRVSFDALKGAAALVLLAPNIPMLFMGEEYGETSPFQYFTDHGDAALVEAVRTGRRREFAEFGWSEEDIPDPNDPATFERSQLMHEPLTDQSALMLQWVSTLIRLRKSQPSLRGGDKTAKHKVWVFEAEQVLLMHRWIADGPATLLVVSFNEEPVDITLSAPLGRWQLLVDSSSQEFSGVAHPQIKEAVITDAGCVLHIRPRYTALFCLSSLRD